MGDIILSGRGLIKRFGTTRVLNDINIDLYQGDFTVIMGSSGSGKSTLLYALSGMDTIHGGKLLFQGRDVTNADEKDMTRLRAAEYGFVFQKAHLISNLSLYENILLAGYIDAALSKKETSERTEALVDRMGLHKAKDRLPSAVSGGEAQRAAVARAVIAQPRILFADEPTGALNKANTDEVLNLLTDLNAKGQTILLVTHDKQAALRGSRILYLEDGAITGEKRLPPYRGKDEAREAELTAWLASMRW